MSGSLKAHYAPRTPLYLQSRQQIEALTDTDSVAVVFDADVTTVAHIYLAFRDSELYASHLYAMLRQLDEQNYSAIYLEQPPLSSEWEAVNDRISRAAAAFSA